MQTGRAMLGKLLGGHRLRQVTDLQKRFLRIPNVIKLQRLGKTTADTALADIQIGMCGDSRQAGGR